MFDPSILVGPLVGALAGGVCTGTVAYILHRLSQSDTDKIQKLMRSRAKSAAKRTAEKLSLESKQAFGRSELRRNIELILMRIISDDKFVRYIDPDCDYVEWKQTFVGLLASENHRWDVQDNDVATRFFSIMYHEFSNSSHQRLKEIAIEMDTTLRIKASAEPHNRLIEAGTSVSQSSIAASTIRIIYPHASINELLTKQIELDEVKSVLMICYGTSYFGGCINTVTDHNKSLEVTIYSPVGTLASKDDQKNLKDYTAELKANGTTPNESSVLPTIRAAVLYGQDQKPLFCCMQPYLIKADKFGVKGDELSPVVYMYGDDPDIGKMVRFIVEENARLKASVTTYPNEFDARLIESVNTGATQ